MKINIPIIADLISNSFLFTTTLIFISIITSNIAKVIGNKFPSSINVSFGLIFGTLKGYMLSALAFSIIMNVYGSSKNEPEWFSSSKSYQPLLIGSDIIKPFTDSLFGSLSEKKSDDDKKPKNEINNFIKKLEKTKDNLKYLERATEDAAIEEQIEEVIEDEGYKKDQIKKMDRLINSITD